MPILVKISGLLLAGGGALVVENNPGELRNNICSWDFVAPCADWFDSAAVNQVVFLCLLAVSGVFFLSLIIPLLAKNYKQTVTEIAEFNSSKKPPPAASVPQQDLRIEHRFHVDSGHAELVLRNTSTKHALENVEVTFANFSIEGAPYTPIDVLSRLKARPRGALQDTINAKDQKYYRFARVHPTQDERKYRIRLWNVVETKFFGKECIVKFRISTKQSPAKLVYLHLSVDDTGHLTVSDYKRNKAKQSSTEYQPLNDAVMDAWERIRTLPEFDTQPSHSPEFMSLRDYYEREPAKLPGIAAQILFNRADPAISIEGVAPPRTTMEVIPHDKAAGYRFSDDAKELFDIFDTDKPAEQRRRYINLRVKRTNIERRVRAIEEDNGKG